MTKREREERSQMCAPREQTAERRAEGVFEEGKKKARQTPSQTTDTEQRRKKKKEMRSTTRSLPEREI